MSFNEKEVIIAIDRYSHKNMTKSKFRSQSLHLIIWFFVQFTGLLWFVTPKKQFATFDLFIFLIKDTNWYQRLTTMQHIWNYNSIDAEKLL